MKKKGAIFKGLLKRADGRRELMEIPGSEDSDGAVYVPEDITVDDVYFRLDKTQVSDEWFEYSQQEPMKNELIPFDLNLH